MMNTRLISGKGKRLAPPKRRAKRSIAVLLVLVLLLSITAPAYAAALERSTPKEEVVYINLNSDGSVDRIYVVNTFELNESGQIIDYGDYTALRNMTTNDEIVFENEIVRIDTDARKLYYEGTLNRNSMPWVLSFCYMLDGKEYQAEDLAGKSGALTIIMSVRQNPDCNSEFFNNFALQATVTLDTELCTNIVAEDATPANVGSDRQLSYLILPGTEEDYTITADVVDFEMASISINGIHMNMSITKEDIEDTEELDEKVAEMQDGAEELDDGADDLMDGAKDIRDGTKSIVDAVKEAKDGTSELSDGVDELSNGVQELYDGAEELKNGSTDLIDGTEELKDGIQIVLDGAAELRSGAEDLEDGAKDLHSGVRSLRSGLNQLTAQNSTLQTMSNTLFDNTLAMSSGVLGSYAITKDTDVSALMTLRQNELLSDAEKEKATQDAITARMSELQRIAFDENSSTEDREYARTALQYWQMTVLLQQMEVYQDTLSSALAQAGDDPQAQLAAKEQVDAAFSDVLTQYNTLIVQYGSQEKLLAAYQELSDAVAANETAVIEGMVTAAMTEAVLNDPTYQALAALSYYQGVVAYTNGVASAASGASFLASGAGDLAEGASSLHDGTSSVYDGLDELLDGAVELNDGTYELNDGVVTLMNGIVTLQDGVITLQDGVITLKDGVVALCDGAIELYDGTVELYDGTIELKDGTLELLDKTATMKNTILDSVVDAVNEMFGADFKPISFVDERNINVSMVQFVIQTPKIAIPEPEIIEEEPIVLNFWEKLLNLFGLYDPS